MKNYLRNHVGGGVSASACCTLLGGVKSYTQSNSHENSLLTSNHPVSTGSHKSLLTPSVLCLATMAAVLLAPNVAMATNYIFGNQTNFSTYGGKGGVDGQNLYYGDSTSSTAWTQNIGTDSGIYGSYGSYIASASTPVTLDITGSTLGFILGSSVSANVSNVTITVTNSTINGDEGTGNQYVYGAYVSSGTGSATNSSVTIDSSYIGGAVYATYARSAEASYGSTTIQNKSTVEGSVRGSYSGGGAASYGSVTITDSTVNGDIHSTYGSTDATYGTVSITGSTVTNSIISAGWSSGGGSVTNNTLTIDSSTISTANIYGGVNTSGSATVSGNTISILNGSTVTASNVMGGYGQASADVDQNTLTISGSGTTVSASSVYGGMTNSGEATYNEVEISDGAAVEANVYGGDSQNSDVNNNTVTISGSETSVTGNISGGASNASGTVDTNSVTIDDAEVTGSVYGGISTAGDATKNTVTLNSGSVTGDVYAGRVDGDGTVQENTLTLNNATINGSTVAAGFSAGAGEVSNNTFDINGGTLSGGLVYAGFSGSNGTVENNTLNLNGGTVSGTLYAGYSTGGTATNNTINLDGNAEGKLSDIDVGNAILYGSNIAVVTGSDGNTLNIKNFSGNIGNIGKFDTINIDLYGIDVADAAYGSGSVIYLTDTSGAGTNLTNSTVNIYNSEITYNDRSVVYTSASSLADAYTIVENNNGAGFMTKTNATITEQLLFVQNPDDYSDPQYAVYELITDEDDGTISYTKTDIDPDSAPPSPEPTPTPEPTPDPGPGPAPEPTDEDKAISALAGTAAKLSMYYAQLDDLRKRLGEVRYGAQDGIWARVIYQQDSFSGTSSYGAKQKWYGLNVGVDHIISQDEDKMWLIGANFKYGHSKEKLKRHSGGKGNLNDYGVNVYATYANQYGCYADFVLTFDEYKQKLGVSSDGSSSKGDYSSWGWGASIEVGKMFSFSQNDENWGPWQSHWWVEPQAQLSYYWLDGKDFSMSSGKRVTQDNGQSLVGRLGLVVGKKWSYGGSTKVDKRYVQAYLKGGVKHEFLGKQDIKISGTRYDDRLRGTTGYYGAGVDWNLTRQLKAYAQVERESGGKYKKDIQASVGLKWQF